MQFIFLRLLEIVFYPPKTFKTPKSLTDSAFQEGNEALKGVERHKTGEHTLPPENATENNNQDINSRPLQVIVSKTFRIFAVLTKNSIR